MDKYVKMLLIKLSAIYNVQIVQIMTYDDSKARIKNVFKFRATEKGSRYVKADITVYNKRDLVSEMAKWLK